MRWREVARYLCCRIMSIFLGGSGALLFMWLFLVVVLKHGANPLPDVPMWAYEVTCAFVWLMASFGFMALAIALWEAPESR